MEFPLAELGAPQLVALDFDDAGAQAAFQREGVCPKAVDPATMVPVRAFVAQNLTDASAVLSAWLVCASNSASNLAFYVGSHLPSTDAELALCATFVATGAAEGGHGSPEANGSGRCPGLTKANDGGLVLGPCEEAVIYVQDMTHLYYPDGVSPVGLRVQLE